MNRYLLLFVLPALLAACNSQQKPLSSGLYLENIDTTVTPGDNFHQFVNGIWIKETEIPSDKASYSAGYMVHEEAQENVRIIIEEAASGDFEQGSDEQKVGDLYASYMDMETRNELGISPLLPEFEKIDDLQSHDELAGYFAYLVKYGVDAPISIFVYPDMKDPTTYALYNWQGGLGLPDREYYLADDEKSQNIRKSYAEHISKMFELAGLSAPSESANSILALETSIAEKHLRKEDTRNMVMLYNMWPVDSLNSLTPNFEWNDYLSEVGLPELEKIVVTQPDYTVALNEIITSYSLPEWKTYLKWVVLNDAAYRLSEDFDAQNFAFYGTTLTGTPERQERWRRAVNNVNSHLGEVVGKVYVSKHFPPEAKERMEVLVDNLLEAYRISITNLDWMGEETKEQALDKLSKFTPKIGYPDKWKDYSDVRISPDNLDGNTRSANLSAHNREMAKVGGPIDKTEWGMTPQTVNAYYNPAMNEIVFPAAILQPPFFDMTADDAVNYGAIGAIIGHEIGHGFDDQGSTFDGDGVLRNWWTDEDRAEFEKRTAALISQYNEFEAIPGAYVNGAFTLGENIGDLGGLSIALNAYKLSLDGEEAPVMDGYTGVQRVFLGYAQAWLNKARAEAVRVQINTDPHSPAKFRVNGVVRNVPEFYAAFEVQPDDSLYLAPEERVKIW